VRITYDQKDEVTRITKGMKIMAITTTLFPGRYVQGVGAMKTVGKEALRFGDNALLIADPYILKNVFRVLDHW
jgi:hypothetical protein